MTKLHAKVIVNPKAGSHSVSRRWPLIKQQLDEAGLSFDHEFTEDAGHALEIANRAISHGYQYLIAVGGDGTVNEVANGIMRSRHPLSVTLGIVNAGTAHAFCFSLGLAENQRGSNPYSFLVEPRSTLIDIGLANCWYHGQLVERFFLNEASLGLVAEIVDSWKSLPNHFGKRGNYLLRTIAGYRSLFIHRNKKIKLRVGNKIEHLAICALVLSNGRYLADRMMIAPQASLYDGLLDATVVSDVSKIELLKIRPTLYDGSHVKHTMIRAIKADTISVESDDRVLVEADGDILGECPATFKVMPSALKVVVF